MILMGIDIGTTGCKAAVFDQAGNVMASAYCEYDIIRRIPGQAELDSIEVWDKICQVISASAAQAGRIDALSITSMGEAMVPVDRNGRICGNSVLGTDTRGLKYLELLTAEISAEEIYSTTGQPVGAGYALPNLCRIKNEEPELYRQTARFIPWADFVTYMLTGEMAANYSLASRTLLFDNINSCWSQKIAAAVGFDVDKLPTPAPSGRTLGRISPNMSRTLGLPSSLKVVSASHDQCAAAIGSGLCESGSAMLGLGTYACMVMTHGRSDVASPFSRRGLNIEPHAIYGQNVSFIYHGSGGALLKWLRNEMFRDLHGDKVYQRMDAELNQAKNATVVLPYFAETGPLDYAPGGQGMIAGLSLSHSRADILKGAMEGIVFYFKDALEQLRNDGAPIRKLHVSGGGAESKAWLRMISDILELPVVKPEAKECGALGAAIIAGVGAGFHPSYEVAISHLVKTETVYHPQLDNKKRHSTSFEQYISLKTAVSSCKIKQENLNR